MIDKRMFLEYGADNFLDPYYIDTYPYAYILNINRGNLLLGR